LPKGTKFTVNDLLLHEQSIEAETEKSNRTVRFEEKEL